MWEAVSFRVSRKWLCKFEEPSSVSKFYFISHNQSRICGSHESKTRMLDSEVQMVPLIVVVSLYEFWGRFSKGGRSGWFLGFSWQYYLHVWYLWGTGSHPDRYKELSAVNNFLYLVIGHSFAHCFIVSPLEYWTSLCESFEAMPDPVSSSILSSKPLVH